jgi:hypothetical protein
MRNARPVVRLTLAAFFVAAFLFWGRDRAHRADAEPPGIQLTNGQASRAALIERFVQALSANDRKAIEALRVNEEEYRTLIMPGSVKPGQPPQQMPEAKSEYFWKHHDTLSTYTLNALLEGRGGKPYTVEKVDCPRVEELAWYTAHRDPIIHLGTAEGSVVELQVGTIAEHDGHFKFISYRSD